MKALKSSAPGVGSLNAVYVHTYNSCLGDCEAWFVVNFQNMLKHLRLGLHYIDGTKLPDSDYSSKFKDESQVRNK